MRPARPAALVLFLAASLVAACGSSRDVDPDRIGPGGGGGHALPFGDQHAAAAKAAIDSCTGCHGSDYDGGSAESCTDCHEAEAAAADWATDCGFCHAASPTSGAHQAHLVAGTFVNPLPCTSCHVVPAPVLPGSLDHVDGAVDVEFSTTARKGMTNPRYAGAGGSCNVYCHDPVAPVGGTPSPAWTSTAALTCNGCHSATPTSGEHGKHRNDGYECFRCHPGYDNSPATVDRAKHLNGKIDANGGTWQNENGCDGGCH
jgi:predicted CxxxxCH...CXXCH cytochrome family protein